jgi:hypothetical protein
MNTTHTSAGGQVWVWNATSTADMGLATHVPNGHSTSTQSPSFPDPFDSQSPAASDFVAQEYLNVQYKSTNVLVHQISKLLINAHDMLIGGTCRHTIGVQAYYLLSFDHT